MNQEVIGHMKLSKSAGYSVFAMLWALGAPTGYAQERAAVGEAPGPQDYHDGGSTDIVVTGVVPRDRLDSLSGIAILQSTELTAALRPAIGETLQHTAGVSASSFGPTASRPVLRGLQGERVRMLTNGLGSIDVSNTSVDHAVVVNPLLAERIEVLRGPQSLLYGSAAIGGVVNVIDGRIANAVPDEPVHVSALAGYGHAARERNLAASLAVPLGNGLVAHADGSWTKSADMRIGGYALTPALRREAEESAQIQYIVAPDSDIDFAANAVVRDRLPNSASRTWTAGVSLAWIGESGSLGAAYGRFDSRYGIPVRFATRPGQEEEAPTLHLKQDRFDARGQWSPAGAFIDKLTLRIAHADYSHAEIEPSGEVGTVFDTKGTEGRFEAVQAERGPWSGASGMQFVKRNFRAEGEEAYLPPNRLRQFGLFSVQHYHSEPIHVEAGLRWERSRMTANPGPDDAPLALKRRNFDSFSGSLGAMLTIAGSWKLGANLSRTQRAPAPEELFANGPHKGTAAFEIGDPELRSERARSVELLLRRGGDDFSVEVSVFRTWFSGFIYEDGTGEVEDGLPVYRIVQAKARHQGFEAEARAKVATFGDWTLRADALVDYVRATIIGSGPSPRIPPLRMLGGLSLKSSKVDLRGEVERVTGQSRIAASETATPGHTLINAELGWRPWGEERPLSIVLSANNLLDAVARRHASFLKDYAPLAGRDVRMTARLEF
jgi:iron complex outermembrane recepter protein